MTEYFDPFAPGNADKPGVASDQAHVDALGCIARNARDAGEALMLADMLGFRTPEFVERICRAKGIASTL